MTYSSIWNSLTIEQRLNLLNCNKYYYHRRYYNTHKEQYELTYEQFREFCNWVKVEGLSEKDTVEIEDNTEEDSMEEMDTIETITTPLYKDEWEHDRSYWYDDKRDIYVVHLKSRKKPFIIPGEKWRVIKDAYSNWDGSPSSVNEIARKQGLARRTVVELLRTMGTTHDSSLWSDEEMASRGENKLTEELVRRKEERVLVKAQQKEWRRVQKHAEIYQSLDLFAETMLQKFESVKAEYTVPKLELGKPKRGAYSVILSPTDFHWGKYAPSYGNDPYNREIAKARLWKSTKELLERVCDRGQPDEIVVALGGDGLHIDNQTQTTTRGTPQDCDGTPEELAWTYVEMCRDYIDMIRQFGKVKLYVIPGNHDYYTSTLLRAAMKGWFNSASDVTVVEDLSNRQYLVYGDSLICFTHGDIGKVKDWPAIIASEKAREWGNSQQRFIFTGHLHTERELPVFGNVTVYRMPSLAGTDNWHHKSGYKSRKSLVGYIVDKEQGVIGTEVAVVG